MRVARAEGWVGDRAHRSGWPFVMRHVYARSNGHGPWLEDFIEQSYRYDLRKRHGYELPYKQGDPWVGILHHPPEVISPLSSDLCHAARRVADHARFQEMLLGLRGVVCLSKTSQDDAKLWLPAHVNTTALPHPTDLDCEQWSYEAWKEGGCTVFNAGFFLRDTRILHRIPKTNTRRFVRVKPFLKWMVGRDRRLKTTCRKTEQRGTRVTELHFHDNAQYDGLLASSLVVTWLYGASANNVVIECMARCTPLIVNPLPAVVEYLGKQYPLYANSVDEVEHLIHDEEAIRAAHDYLCEQLRETREYYLSAERFAVDLEEFVQSCT